MTRAKQGRTGTVRKPTKPRVLPRTAAIELFHINHKETMRLRLYDLKGRKIRGVEQRVERFLRCHHTNTRHKISPRLIQLIHETGRYFPGRRVEIVAGYRAPSVARNPKSPHIRGLACDLRVAGIKNAELRDFFRTRFKKVGVGFYPNSSFVHLDVRKDRSAFWIDYSGPGQDADYAQNAAQELRALEGQPSVAPTPIDAPPPTSDKSPPTPATSPTPVP